MQVQKGYTRRETWGRQHALGRSRTKANGRWVQVEGEEKDVLPSKEERKVDGVWTKQPSPPHLMHCNHLAGRINEKMTLNSIHPAYILV